MSRGINYSDATPDVTYSYDLVDNRLSMVDGATTTYQYDVLDRLTLVDRGSGQTIGYTYDAVGNLLTRSPGGGAATTYTYDDDNHLATMTVAGQATSYAYDPAGGLIATTLPSTNGYVESRTYDTARRLTEVKNTKAAAVLSKATYTLDPVGNPLTIVTTTTTKTFTYDPADRLTQVCYTVACTGADNFRTYTYDDVGNRLTEVQGAGTTTYIYDAADELTKTTGLGGTVKYTYDLNGSETGAGTRTFTYDLARRVKTTKLGGTTTTYTYDGDGLRRSASTGSGASATTQFLWDPNAPLALLAREADGNGAVLREYQYGHDLSSMIVAGSPFYFHRDGLGDVVNLTSSPGTTQWTYDYHPFGTSRITTKNDPVAPANFMQFTGQYLDPTGLYHLRARQYDPGTGRFLSIDPAPRDASRPFVSSYAYAENNPVLFVDPSGLDIDGACVNGEGTFALAFGEAALCVVVTDDGQGGVILTVGGGGGVGLGGIAGVSVIHSGAAEIYDLEGPFLVAGGSGALVVGLQTEGFLGTGHCGQVVAGGSGGPVAGATGSVQGGATWTIVLLGLGEPKSGCTSK